jgi:hypothetical protein
MREFSGLRLKVAGFPSREWNERVCTILDTGEP